MTQHYVVIRTYVRTYGYHISLLLRLLLYSVSDDDCAVLNNHLAVNRARNRIEESIRIMKEEEVSYD